MKKIILLLFPLMMISCFEPPEIKCADFRTGKFRFDYKIDGKIKSTVFLRTDSLEIETFEGKTDTSSIRWVNECEYILQKKHPKNMQEKAAIDMKILTTSKNSYTFEFGLVGSSKKQTGTVVKLIDN